MFVAAVVVVEALAIVVVENYQMILEAALVAEIAVEHRQLMHYCHGSYDSQLLVAFADPVEIDYSMDAI